MPQVLLRPGQKAAVEALRNGCVLRGGVGSGKTPTAVAYFWMKVLGGGLDYETGRTSPPSRKVDLYVITTPKKRDSLDWEGWCAKFGLSRDVSASAASVRVVVDSWNNIAKYREIHGAFFIFDEQRAVGYGVWAKSMIRISRNNEWIMLSATPGDVWMDYMPLFIANGYYKNKTDFCDQHVVYDRFARYPKVKRYVGTAKLSRLRNQILVNMHVDRSTVRHRKEIYCSYPVEDYEWVKTHRKALKTGEPLRDAAAVCNALRSLCGASEGRSRALLEIMGSHEKLIIFYNFDYELEIIREVVAQDGRECAEWNGHFHDPLPSSGRWAYLVQYTAGSDAWNCTTTDTIVFWSMSYSWRQMEQAEGRIDRIDTPYRDLWYYRLTSKSSIEEAIRRAVSRKKVFNERAFLAA